ncbi:MAG TPA: hypothetical protein GXZ45_10360 [Propionibacterium sp.]|nr:hypothetical protein [Propionibacterium sp.]
MLPTHFLRALAAAGTAGVLVLAADAVLPAVNQASPVLAAFDRVPGEPIVGDDPVTIAFAGDVHFEKQLAAVAEDPDGLASLSPYLSAADVTVVNLETAVTDGGKRLAGKQFTFAAPPSALTTLANAGVDAVSLANNHAVDFGKAGLEQTLAAREGAPLAMVGIGADEAEAFAPAVFEVDGVSVAVLAATQLREHTTVYFSATPEKPGVASMEDPARLLTAVHDAAAQYDVVVVVPHWGIEKHTCPSDKQVTVARQLAEAGADVVVGGHSHRVMGSGWLDDTYVGYGLGNFVWFLNTTFPGRSTGVLTIEVDKQKVAEKRVARAKGDAAPGSIVVGDAWAPLSVAKSGIPAPDPGTAQQMMADRAKAVACSGLDGAPASRALVATEEGSDRPTGPTKPADTPLVVDGIPIVSRQHPLTKDYVPAWAGEENGLHPDVRAAFEAMAADARADKMVLNVRSGYRDYKTQDASFKRAWSKYGERARRYYAEAGHSEHQTGLALDLSSSGVGQPGYAFAKTPESGWVAENAHRYGFIIRYPEGKQAITGVDHEPWHLRWVGVELAAELAKTPGITLEEYLGLPLP